MDHEADPADLPDEVLIQSYVRDRQGRRGQLAANTLIDRWSGRVYRWSHRVVRNREQALDLAQESLLQMIDALPQYQPRGRFSAWLFVIVHNRCISATRRRSINVDHEIDADQLVSHHAGPEHEFESAETLRRIFAAMDSALDPLERTALWLRAYEDLGIEDITRVLGLENATGARGLLQTARRKLRASLAETGEGKE
jgi:RNA polymerase sigma-70 factor (ECF subfamily)